jgi:hypothetical protein
MIIVPDTSLMQINFTSNHPYEIPMAVKAPKTQEQEGSATQSRSEMDGSSADSVATDDKLSPARDPLIREEARKRAMNANPAVSQLIQRLKNGFADSIQSPLGEQLKGFASSKVAGALSEDAAKAAVESAFKSGADGLQASKSLFKMPLASASYKGLVRHMTNRVTKLWSPKEKTALRRTLDTLEQLAGADGRFNYGDKAQVIDALSRDVPGILRMAHQEVDKIVPGVGNNLAHEIVGNSFKGTRFTRANGSRRGPFQRARDNRRAKIMSQARQQMNLELNKALQSVKVDPATASKIDNQARSLTIAQMTQLSTDLETLGARFGKNGNGERLLRGAGQQAEILFKKHLSMQPILRGGIPSPTRPNAVLDTATDALKGIEVK